MTIDVQDITESAETLCSLLPTSRDLYYRWERQQWSVAELHIGREADAWRRLRPFSRGELFNALAELEVGEVCVTATLSSLVDRAPTKDDQIYLATQLADEGRHVRFFQTYLNDAAGAETATLAESADYTQSFAPELTRITAAVWQQNSRQSWYEALVYYHLVTEGVLAATALRGARQEAKRLQLPILVEGLTNVTRDESRHVSFGILAARQGVQAGYGDTITNAYLQGLQLAALVLVAPRRRQQIPALRTALMARARQLEERFVVARERAIRQLTNIGLADRVDQAAAVWDEARTHALNAYEQTWGTMHPIRMAGIERSSR